MIHPRLLTIACGLLLAAATSPLARAADARLPNIIYILADDLGYGDLGCYGQKLIRTPRLDQLAAEGMRFTQHYAGAPMCAPSRCALMTGFHVGHARIRSNSKLAIHPEDVTIAEVLRTQGYATCGVGKWGLGREDTTGAPWKQGFDHFFGYLDQTHAHTYYPDHMWRNDQKVEFPENRNGGRKTYSHDLMVEEALDFVRKNRDRPFFLYGAFTIPHAEVTVPEDSLTEYQGRWPEPNKFEGSRTYCPQDQPRAVKAAMITRLDRDLGKLFDLLDEFKLSENTLIIFTSDNGPASAGGLDPKFFNSAGPLRGIKFMLYEGGIRVPCIARWPGHIPAGTTSDLPSAFWDMMPTFAELTSAKAPQCDGVSILPTLLGQSEKQAPRELLYWEFAPRQAIRVGDWKAYRPAPGKPIELYNLAKDIGETNNLAASQPERVAELERMMNDAHVESADFPLVPAK